MKPDYPMIACSTAAEWHAWLDAHHATADGVWLRLYKKASGVATVSYDQALDSALCYGWIDGQVKSLDAASYKQKFTPRRKASLWSKRNIEHVARLTAEGRMQPAGLSEVARAQADGRWEAAYDRPSQMTPPDDLLAALQNNPQAQTFYNTLNKTNVYAIAWSLQTAKTEVTRKRRLEKILTMLTQGTKPI